MLVKRETLKYLKVEKTKATLSLRAAPYLAGHSIDHLAIATVLPNDFLA
jgi:hypothetical protein